MTCYSSILGTLTVLNISNKSLHPNGIKVSCSCWSHHKFTGIRPWQEIVVHVIEAGELLGVGRGGCRRDGQS